MKRQAGSLTEPDLGCSKRDLRKRADPTLDCEQSLRMVTRARKSSEARESRGEAGEEVSLSANSRSPVLPSLDSTDGRGRETAYLPLP